MNRRDQELPLWAWLGLPLAIVAAEYLWRLADEASYRQIWDSELGPLETGTVLLLLPAVAAGALLVLRRRRALPSPLLTFWFAAVTLGAFYFAGEEASWGQHWFGWGTPDPIRAVNDQAETNLHNMSSWLDQKPRLLLEIWVLGAGLIYPLLRPQGPERGAWRWFWPDRRFLPVSLLAVLVVLPERLHKWFGWAVPPPFDVRSSETQEMLFAVYLGLYLVSRYRRAGRGRQAAD